MKTDLYQNVTDQIVASLEQGVRPWMKPWNAEHAAGRITRPLRANGIPYQGINVLVLWSESVTKGGKATAATSWYPDYPAVMNIAKNAAWGSGDLFPQFGMPSL